MNARVFLALTLPAAATYVGCPGAVQVPPDPVPQCAPAVVRPPTEIPAPVKAPAPPPPPAAHRLEAFFEALGRAERGEGAAVILHVGDSHIASDSLSGPLRRLFQTRFGDGGRGYAQPGRPGRYFRQLDMSYSMSRGWKVNQGQRSSATGKFGLSGIRLDAEKADVELTRSSCKRCDNGSLFDSFSVSYLRQPSGGSFGLSVDGHPVLVVHTASSPGSSDLGVVRHHMPLERHEVRLRAQGDGPISVLGIATDRAGPGLRYESVGLNGATVRDFLSFDDHVLRAEVGMRAPHLIVVGLGTNEAYDLQRFRLRRPEEQHEDATPRFRQRMADLLARLISPAAPGASCLVLLPPDLAPPKSDESLCRKEAAGGADVCIWPSVIGWSEVVAGYAQAAREAGCAVWDQQAAMGGPGRINVWAHMTPAWARRDGVHLTDRGYVRLARGLYEDLMIAYADWTEGGGDRPLDVHVVLPEEPAEEAP